MVWRFLSSVAGAFVRFYHLCERIGTAMGALKVMAVVIGGVLLVLAAIALVAALLLGYAIGSLGLAKVVLLILAVVLALAGVIFIIVGMRGRQAKTPVEETAKGQRFDVGGIQLEVIPPLEVASHRPGEIVRRSSAWTRS